MKKYAVSFLAAILGLALLLSGCGSTSKGGEQSAFSDFSDVAQNGTAERPAAPEYESGQEYLTESSENLEKTDAEVPAQEKKIVKHVNINMQTMEFEETMAAIIEKIDESGGYVQEQSVDGMSMYYEGDYYERSARIDARVPVEDLDAVAESIGKLGNVTSQDSSISDISDSYYDTAARLEALEVQEDRLLELMSQAENVEDIIKLEEALSNVRLQIEELTATIANMDKQVAYSYLSIYLSEVSEYRVVENSPKNFGDKMMISLRRAGENIANALEDILFFVVENGVVVIIYFAIALVVIWVVVKIVRVIFRKNSKKSKKGKKAIAADSAETAATGSSPADGGEKKDQ